MTKNHSKNTAAIAAALSQDRTSISRRVAMLALAAASSMALALSVTPPAGAEPATSGFVYTADEYGNSVSWERRCKISPR